MIRQVISYLLLITSLDPVVASAAIMQIDNRDLPQFAFASVGHIFVKKIY